MATVSKAEREQAEARRLAATELFAQKVPQAEIARRFGVTPTAVCKWRKRWLAEGAEGLRSKGQPGYPPLLSQAQCTELVEVLKAPPKASGFDGGWTLARVATVIRRRFGVVYRYPRRCAHLSAIGLPARHEACLMPGTRYRVPPVVRWRSEVSGPGRSRWQPSRKRSLRLRRFRSRPPSPSPGKY
jgi:transposase